MFCLGTDIFNGLKFLLRLQNFSSKNKDNRNNDSQNKTSFPLHMECQGRGAILK